MPSRLLAPTAIWRLIAEKKNEFANLLWDFPFGAGGGMRADLRRIRTLD